MKIYRKNIFKTFTFWFCISLYITIPLALTIKGWEYSYLQIWLYCLPGVTACAALLVTACNYLIVMDDSFVVRNAVYPFMQIRCRYSDVRKIEIRYAAKGDIYLKIHMRHSKRIKRPQLECIEKTDLYEIMEFLKTKEIDVEPVGVAVNQWIERGKNSRNQLHI